MARIHSVNLYPRPSHSGKGPSLKITSGLPVSGPGGQAHAFSAAQARAEQRERARVEAGAPGHLIDQGLPAKPAIGRVRGRPIVGPNPGRSPYAFPEGLASKLQALPSMFKPPRRA